MGAAMISKIQGVSDRSRLLIQEKPWRWGVAWRFVNHPSIALP
jgi:hypothetical protein